MLRIKFIKNYKQYKSGEILSVSPNEAFGLIDSGFAIVSKDMTSDDYQTTGVDKIIKKTKRNNKRTK